LLTPHQTPRHVKKIKNHDQQPLYAQVLAIVLRALFCFNYICIILKLLKNLVDEGWLNRLKAATGSIERPLHEGDVKGSEHGRKRKNSR